MKKTIILATAVAIASAAHGSYTFTTLSAINENFDGLPTATQTAYFSATVGTQTLISGTGFEGTKTAGTGTAGANLVADTGAGNAGAIYSYGAASDTDRALGSLASGSNIMSFGAVFVNNTGKSLTGLTIAFTQENWRTSTSSVNTLVFGYSTTSTAAGYLTDATTFSANTALDVVGPAAVTTNGALNGNDPANQVAHLATLTFGTAVANGGSIFIRWADANDVGNDAGLAIDNASFTPIASTPEPTTVAALGLGAVAMLRRRKK